MDETKLTAHFPGVDIEITRHVLSDEVVLIGIHAVPSFEAMGRLFPLWRPWFDVAQVVWGPWLSLMSSLAEPMEIK